MDKFTYVTFPGLGINNEIPLNNVAFSVFGKDIMWYGIIITIGIILGFLYADFRARRNEGFKKDELIDFALAGVVFGIIGARIWYVATSFESFKADSFWGTVRNCVAIWEGGLGFYGGLILGALSVVVIALIKKKNILKVLDPIAPGVMIAQILGRWGNFINGEAYGTETDLPWRMGLRTAAMSEPTYVHPTFLYESLWNLIGFIIINFTYKRKMYNGQILLRYLTWYGFGRMLIEGLRTDSLYVGSFRISQVFGFACFFVGSALLIAFDIIHFLKKRDAKVNALSENYKNDETTTTYVQELNDASKVTENTESGNENVEKAEIDLASLHKNDEDDADD